MKNKERSIIDNSILNRFELHIAEEVAFLEYEIQGNKIILVHTEVPIKLQGQGIASELVNKVMDQIQKSGRRMIPFCPYILQFLKKHPMYND